MHEYRISYCYEKLKIDDRVIQGRGFKKWEWREKFSSFLLDNFSICMFLVVLFSLIFIPIGNLAL